MKGAEKSSEEVEGQNVEKKPSLVSKWASISALQHLFKAWSIILENLHSTRELTCYGFNYSYGTDNLILAFTRAMLAKPFGNRDGVS